MSSSNSQLKAIETVYKGYRFRSRLEARYAVFFDALGIEYDYELQGFDLGNGDYYLPDFFISGVFPMWVEIKGSKPTSEEVLKATKLHQQSGNHVLMLWDKLEPRDWRTFANDHNHLLLYTNRNEVFHACRSSAPVYLIANRMGRNGGTSFRNALAAGRQARFEHGETP